MDKQQEDGPWPVGDILGTIEFYEPDEHYRPRRITGSPDQVARKIKRVMNSPRKSVATTKTGTGLTVSSVFLVLDHAIPSGGDGFDVDPILYETCVFDDRNPLEVSYTISGKYRSMRVRDSWVIARASSHAHILAMHKKIAKALESPANAETLRATGGIGGIKL